MGIVYVVGTGRDAATRLTRLTARAKRRQVRFGPNGMFVVRPNRRIALSTLQLERCLEELRVLVGSGQAKVVDGNGRAIDLSGFTAIEAEDLTKLTDEEIASRIVEPAVQTEVRRRALEAATNLETHELDALIEETEGEQTDVSTFVLTALRFERNLRDLPTAQEEVSSEESETSTEEEPGTAEEEAPAAEPSTAEQVPAVLYEDMEYSELRALAHERGIELTSRKKEDTIKALREADAAKE